MKDKDIMENNKNCDEENSPTAGQSEGEEIANSLTHGIGVGLSIAALVLLVIFSAIYGDAWNVVSLSIYGATLIILYLTSTIYHSLRNIKAKKFFKLMDHISIFILIAGTYTPITLVALRGPWGWSIFGVIWGIAVLGTLYKIFFIGKHKIIDVVIYVIMGFTILVAVVPSLQLMPFGMIIWIIIGGACYLTGIIFYAIDKIPYHHSIWHLFVLGGSISHFFGMLFYMTN
ncbi:MAG: PAQR family membrane homeostasis protein TrhA [Spirochaetota bacterium]